MIAQRDAGIEPPPHLTWTEFLTHACENIAFQQLLLWMINYRQGKIKRHSVHVRKSDWQVSSSKEKNYTKFSWIKQMNQENSGK